MRVERSSERYTVLARDWTILYMSPMVRDTLGVGVGEKMPLDRLRPEDVAIAHNTFNQVVAETGKPEQGRPDVAVI